MKKKEIKKMTKSQAQKDIEKFKKRNKKKYSKTKNIYRSKS